MPTIPDELYTQAIPFARHAWWRTMDADLPAAVVTRSGATYYCLVTGREDGENHGLLALRGEEGLSWYRRWWQGLHGKTWFDRGGLMAERCGLGVFFCAKDEMPAPVETDVRAWARRAGKKLTSRHACPVFFACVPGMTENYRLTGEQMADMADILEGFEWLLETDHERVGENLLTVYADGQEQLITAFLKGDRWRAEPRPLPPPTAPTYPPCRLNNDMLAARVRHAQKGDAMQCRFGYLTQDQGDEPEQVPFALFVYCMEIDAPMMPLTVHHIGEVEKLLVSLAEGMLEIESVPRSLQVADDRTAQLLQSFCEQTGIPMQRKRRLPELEDCLGVYYDGDLEDDDLPDGLDGWEGLDGWDDPDGMMPFDLTQALCQLEFFNAMVRELSDETLQLMPESFRMLLHDINEQGFLESAVEKRLKDQNII